jgi:hypothetical protein
MKKWLMILVAMMICNCIMVIPGFATANLANNSSFEEEEGAMPRGWQVGLCDQNTGVTELKYEKSGGHSGGKYITIINHAQNDARIKQEISIKENALYKISGWIKTQNLDTNLKGANISIDGRLETSQDIRGTNGQWQYNEMYVKTGTGVNSMIITLGIGGYGSMTTGQASFDDVMVEEIGIPEGAVVAQLGNMETPKNAAPAIDFASIGGPTSTIWALVIAAIIVAIAGALFYYWLVRKSTSPEGAV